MLLGLHVIITRHSYSTQKKPVPTTLILDKAHSAFLITMNYMSKWMVGQGGCGHLLISNAPKIGKQYLFINSTEIQIVKSLHPKFINITFIPNQKGKGIRVTLLFNSSVFCGGIQFYPKLLQVIIFFMFISEFWHDMPESQNMQYHGFLQG